MSGCYQNVIHVQLTYFYLCIFHRRPTDNLFLLLCYNVLHTVQILFEKKKVFFSNTRH